MFSQILIAIILGSIAGTITGLIPGIHINLVATLVLTSSLFLLKFTTPIILAIFIISMAVLHTFTNILPSIYLGAPEAGTALSVLPGHRLLLEGKGYEAVTLTVIGSLLGLLSIIIITPLLLLTTKFLYSSIKNYIAIILIIVSIFLIIRDPHSKLWALISFTLAGVLGLAVFNLNLEQPLLPLLSGLFGTSNLILSFKDNTKIPPQIITSNSNVTKKEVSKSIGSGLFASLICGFLPGIGAAEAAIVASSASKKWTTRSFLVLVGSIETIVMIISFIALYTIDKARNGAVVVISKILETMTMDYFLLFIGASLVVAGIATIATLQIAKIFSKIITKVNYQKLCLSIIILIIIVVTMLTGFIGLVILTISTFVGMIPALKGIERNHLMGCLILPVILFFLL